MGEVAPGTPAPGPEANGKVSGQQIVLCFHILGPTQASGLRPKSTWAWHRLHLYRCWQQNPYCTFRDCASGTNITGKGLSGPEPSHLEPPLLAEPPRMALAMKFLQSSESSSPEQTVSLAQAPELCPHQFSGDLPPSLPLSSKRAEDCRVSRRSLNARRLCLQFQRIPPERELVRS